MMAVVLSHVLRGLFAAGLVDPGLAWAGWLDRGLYLMHLPLFAFVTGLLLAHSVDRDGDAAYLRRRLVLVGWLYLVWALLQGAAEVLTSPIKNVPVTWGDVFALWRPLGHLWFLPWLALATLVVVLIAPWRPGPFHAVALVVGSSVSLAAWGWELDFAVARGWALIVFFLAGAALTSRRFTASTTRLPPWSVALVGLAGLGVWVVAASVPWVTTPTIVDGGRTPASVALGAGGSLGALIGVLAVSVVVARQPSLSGWLATLGRLSLQVYLAHILFTAGTRIVLVRLGIVDVGVHLTVGVAAGVVGPLLLERATRPVPWLFAPPSGWRHVERVWDDRGPPASGGRPREGRGTP